MKKTVITALLIFFAIVVSIMIAGYATKDNGKAIKTIKESSQENNSLFKIPQ